MNELLQKDGYTYRLVLEDNFEGTDLNPAIWARCPEQRRADIGGYWCDAMTEVRDGNLWLWAKIDEDGVPRSGGIRSLNRFEQTGGYFECRMMFPKTTGFWGAFWMMCGNVGQVDGSAVSGVEIDIIESGECPRRGVNHALHWDGYGEAHKSCAHVITAPELYEGWHTYALAWTDSAYIFYVDGKETWRTAEPGICNRPGYLKLTTEFGSWAAPLVPEELPDCCRVDWVRVYEPVR